MKIKEIQDNSYIDSYEVITHREDIFSTSGTVLKEFKELESKFVTDGEISEKTEKEIIFTDNYTLEDGYQLNDVDYIRKRKISFKKFSFIIAYNIVFKKDEKYNTYADIDNMTAYVKDKEDMINLNKVRRIAKSIKRTFRKMNGSQANIRGALTTDPIDKCENSEEAANVYKLKRF